MTNLSKRSLPIGGVKPRSSTSTKIVLTEHQILVIRQAIVLEAGQLIGIPYAREDDDPKTPWTGKGKWMDFSKRPVSLDCSGLTTGCYKKNGVTLVHGSKNQFNATIKVDYPQLGDLAFAAEGKNITKVYHVGMVLDDLFIIESRARQKGTSFVTGQVIIRPRKNWEAWNNFVGYRAHPKLILQAIRA